ncbi:disease resistance protein, partial [Quercus suber]
LEYLREFVVSGCSKLAKFEDHEIASTHEPEIEIISSKTPESSHAHETKDAEISSGAETESVFSQIKGESQLSKLTVHVKEPMEPATPLAVSTSSTNKGATVEPFLSESSKFFVLPDPETKPISLEKPELLSAHGTSKQTAVEPISASPVMGADREVQMEGLLPEEAWKLFREQVGGIIESPNIQQFARAIVQKCYGFPLLIIVTGRALAKENDTLAWMHASKEFSECSAHGIYGHEALIQKLKFSYDRLEGPDVKSCFLYCALFPEDQEINIDKLVDYWIQEGLVAGNWPDSYKRGSDISVQVGLSIKMHNLIWDLASRILSLEVEGCQFVCGSYSKMTQLSHMRNRLPILDYHRFLSSAGAGLIELPLPERPNCLRLLALFLQRNHNIRVIPTSFFDLMPSLTILNLSKTRIKFLPESICKLTILEVLILRDCERLVRLPSEVGSLRQLVVLDLQGTKLNKLSNEISELASLRHLKVSFYGSVNQREYVNLPRELLSHVVIGNLSELETLSIDVYPGDMRWNENVKSVIDEVSNLTNLTTFCCYFPEVEFLERFLRKSATWKIGGLTEFKFVVGHDVKRFASQNVDNLELDHVQWGQCLRFVNGEIIPNAVVEVLTRTTAFCLDHHVNVLSLSEFGLGNFYALRLCVVRECPEIQEIIAGAELSGAVFPILEHLTINSLPDSRKICKEMIPQGSFAKLRVLTVYTCPNLEFVFASSMVQCFSNLEELIVEDCSAIKKIVDSDGGTLPSLKRLKLHSLPNLVNIMKGAWPPLENISFYDCPMLKKLGIDSNLIRTIKEIKAEKDWWEKLEWQDSSLYSRLQARFTLISDEDF